MKLQFFPIFANKIPNKTAQREQLMINKKIY